MLESDMVIQTIVGMLPINISLFKALLKLTEDKFDSKLAQWGDLSSEKTKKDAHLKYMVLIKGTFVVQDPSLVVSTLTV